MEMILSFAMFTSAIAGLTGYTILNSTMSWKSANDSCTLITPRITYTTIDMFLDIDAATMETNVEYWVGYKYVNKLFLYTGCGKANVTKQSTGNFTSEVFTGTPGSCYSACNTNLIGLQGSSCFCFDVGPSVSDRQQDCNDSISYLKPSGGQKSVSLYSVANVTLNTEIDTEKEGCVAFDRKNMTFRLEFCDKELPIMCQTQKSRESTIHVSDQRQPWSSSVKYCFTKNKYPLRQQTAKEIDSESEGLFWTGLFLSRSVIKTFGEPGTAVEYGYAVTDGDKPAIRFKFKTTYRKAICNDPQTTTTNQTSAGFSSTMSISTTNAQTNEYKKTKDDNKGSDKKVSSKLLYVLVPVIAVIVIVVVVVAVVCYRKRAKVNTARQKPALSREYSEVQDAYEETGHAYSVPLDTLESKQRQPSNPNEEGAYDVSGATGTVRDIGNHTESDNVYNMLNTLSDDTYDHTNLTNATQTVKSGKTSRINDDVMYSTSQTKDDSYDTTMPKQREPVLTDNVYNHANNDETYSQTSRTAHSNISATDNIYD